MIPDVRRNLAISAFERLIEEVRDGTYDGPLKLVKEDIEEVNGIRSSGQYDTPYITPKGAKLLLRMLEMGLVPQQSGSSSPRIAPELAAYAEREEEVAQLTIDKASRTPEEVKREAEEAVAARKARISYLAENPHEARPEEIKRSIIDQVFIARDGYGTGATMKFGGVTCHKELHNWISNKGYRNTEIIIWWTDKNDNRYGDAPFVKPLNRRARGDENIHKYNRSMRED